jgi:LmbE family N-acetylglucosaminyl deacetylase
VGLCDLSAGELGTNGTPVERRSEADAAAESAGRVLARKSGLARRRPVAKSRADPNRLPRFSGVIDRARSRCRTGRIGIPITAPPAKRSPSRTFRSGLRRFDTGEPGEPWRPEWICYYFINDGAEPSFVVDVSSHYDRKREALACYVSQFRAAHHGRATDAAHGFNVPAAD